MVHAGMSHPFPFAAGGGPGAGSGFLARLPSSFAGAANCSMAFRGMCMALESLRADGYGVTVLSALLVPMEAKA